MELDAVVLAGGKGSRFMDLTSSCTKALLPIGNLPLLWYPLHVLECNGFRKALVLVQESTLPEFESFASKTDLGIKMELCALPSSNEDLGTADALRHVADKITVSSLFFDN